MRKETEDHEYPWEFYEFGRLCALIDRLKGTKSECITGIVLCNNYPVGVLFPRKLLGYQNGCELLGENSPLTDDEKNRIFSKAYECVEEAIKHDVYPENLWLGNILINPKDYNDVRLFGLDESGTVARVETKQYVEDMKKKNNNIKKHVRIRFNQLRNNDY